MAIARWFVLRMDHALKPLYKLLSDGNCLHTEYSEMSHNFRIPMIIFLIFQKQSLNFENDISVHTFVVYVEIFDIETDNTIPLHRYRHNIEDIEMLTHHYIFVVNKHSSAANVCK